MDVVGVVHVDDVGVVDVDVDVVGVVAVDVVVDVLMLHYHNAVVVAADV